MSGVRVPPPLPTFNGLASSLGGGLQSTVNRKAVPPVQASDQFGGPRGRINADPLIQGLRLAQPPSATKAILQGPGVPLSNLDRDYTLEIPSREGRRKLRDLKRVGNSPIPVWDRQFQRVARRLSNLGARRTQGHRGGMTCQPNRPPTNNARSDFQLKTAGRAATLRSGSENSWGAIRPRYRVVESRASFKWAGGGS